MSDAADGDERERRGGVPRGASSGIAGKAAWTAVVGVAVVLASMVVLRKLGKPVSTAVYDECYPKACNPRETYNPVVDLR